jgi:hypothetical protein
MDGAFGHYERECRFYAELAAESPVRTPRPHFVAFEPGSRRFTLLLEDVAVARAGDQVAGLSARQAAEALAAIVPLHAHWWRSPRLERGWLTDHPGGATALEDTVRRSWPAYAAFAAGALTWESLAVGEALTRALPALRRRAAGRAPTLVHGDLRADNILFGADPVCLVDWQLAARAPGAFDVAFLLTSSLTPAVRRAHEEDLLRDYHRRLVQAGVADYPLSECVADYRLGALIGWCWPIVGVGLLDLEGARGAAVFRTWAERMAAAASDLDLAKLMD